MGADSQGFSPDALGTAEAPKSGAHYPSFSIGPDGVIHRSVSSSPVLPSLSSVLKAPYMSQFDGSTYEESNCGPTSLAMALGALGVPSAPLALRALADKQMGTSDPNNGTSWESLAYAAKQNGVSVFGLTNGSSKAYRKWTLTDLQSELAKQRPTMMLVRYRELPDHKASSYSGDHYIVALGTSGGNIVYNDPASNDGAYLTASPDQLMAAWRDPASGIAYSAMSLYR